jgi:hypothetical protein
MRALFTSVIVSLLAIGLGVAQARAAGESEAGKNHDTNKAQAKGDMTGQCHCGYVKYRVRGPILDHNYCSCRGCQKATGTLKAPFVVVAKASFRTTAGTPSPYRAHSGVKCDVHGTWHFCPKCGTQVFWLGDKSERVDIFAGTLDNTSLFKPEG